MQHRFAVFSIVSVLVILSAGLSNATVLDEPIDVLKYVRLVMLVQNSKEPHAYLRNFLDKQELKIEAQGERARLHFKDEKGATVLDGRVLRIGTREVYFHANGRYYKCSIGQTLREALDEPLSAETVKKLMLPAVP